MTTHGPAISAIMAEHKNTFQQYIDLEEILLCLKRKNVIQDDEYHDLMEETREKKKKQTLFLLKKIPAAGDNAFLLFLECLKKRHMNLAEALLKSLDQEDEAYAKEVRIKWQGDSSAASQGTTGHPAGSSKKQDLYSWDKINERRLQIRDKYMVDTLELLRTLEQTSVFTYLEAKQVREITDLRKQYDELFNVLTSKNPKKYVPIFLQALVDMDREDVRDFLQGLHVDGKP
ncbi:unnamed protein product [Darwinula stevensoni]|uniref:CARD domain-containing protein n=1 Tax=Darwinula stevensoni TaxID=69355 RepID=A0A7R9AFF9_9CRUS|nr:unnamed protein product [Darwinula stevensoni]CAG0903268.1 unnamed protein product [Darwinula stevensoni]